MICETCGHETEDRCFICGEPCCQRCSLGMKNPILCRDDCYAEYHTAIREEAQRIVAEKRPKRRMKINFPSQMKGRTE